MNKNLSSIFWLWIPVLGMVVQIGLEIFIDAPTLSKMLSEHGPHETMQAVIMVVCFFLALYYFLNSKISKTILLRFWFFLAALCSLYVAAEEVSYGQHIWDWATPDFWARVNDQQETNLHNTSSWFDQKPRLLLIIGIVGGTLVAPLLKKYNLLKLPEALDMLLPAKELRVIAFFVVAPQIFEKTFEIFDVFLFVRFSEVQELYIFYFVLLYLITLKNKILSLPSFTEKT